MKQLVSIIIPAYNAGKYIRGSIKTILEQTYNNFEIIIVDDGSTDNTAQMVRDEYQGDARIKLISQKNGGVAVARNNGIRTAKGEYIAFLDPDDYYLPSKIEKEVKFLQDHPEFDIAYCNVKHFYDDNLNELYQHQGKTPSGQVFENLLDGFFGQLNTVLIPKRILEKVGMFDENFRDSEEWDMFLRIARAGYTFGFLDEDLVRIRISSGSLSRYENQWKMKSHNLHVFEELNKSMSEEERKKYHMPKRLARLRFILAVAYVAAKKKDLAMIELKKIKYDSLLKKIFTQIVFLFTWLLPESFLELIVVKIWSRRHQKLFKRVV